MRWETCKGLLALSILSWTVRVWTAFYIGRSRLYHIITVITAVKSLMSECWLFQLSLTRLNSLCKHLKPFQLGGRLFGCLWGVLQALLSQLHAGGHAWRPALGVPTPTCVKNKTTWGSGIFVLQGYCLHDLLKIQDRHYTLIYWSSLFALTDMRSSWHVCTIFVPGTIFIKNMWHKINNAHMEIQAAFRAPV